MKILLIIMSLGGNNVVPMDSMAHCQTAVAQIEANALAAKSGERTRAICVIQGN